MWRGGAEQLADEEVPRAPHVVWVRVARVVAAGDEDEFDVAVGTDQRVDERERVRRVVVVVDLAVEQQRGPLEPVGVLDAM